jgi:hypothetical protein
MNDRKGFFAGVVFSLLLLVLAETSVGQENFLPGFLVSLKGDTIKGLVDYRNWDRNPEKISFKETAAGITSEYYPLQIKSFVVLDESYESAVVQTETSSDDTKFLSHDKNLEIVSDTTFLQVIVRGKKSLYYYKTREGKENFYIWQDSSFQLLIYKKYLKNQDDGTVIAENLTYNGQLTIYLQGCEGIQKRLSEVRYQKNSLEDIFLFYYSCTRENIYFHKKTEKTTVRFGALAGVSVTVLKFYGDFIYLVEAGYQPSFSFSGGLFMDIIFPRSQGKWSVNNELLFTSYNVDGKYEHYFHANRYTTTYTTLGYSYLKINNMLRFKYPVGKFFLYINAGISNGMAIVEKNYAKEESWLFEQYRVEEARAIDDTRKWELGYVLGIGAKFRKFSFEARYEGANGMSEYKYLKSSTYRIYTLFGYRF